jgi:hypothetical protein
MNNKKLLQKIQGNSNPEATKLSLDAITVLPPENVNHCLQRCETLAAEPNDANICNQIL